MVFSNFFLGLLWICPLGQDEATERDDGAALAQAGCLVVDRGRPDGDSRLTALCHSVSVSVSLPSASGALKIILNDNHEWQTLETLEEIWY